MFDLFTSSCTVSHIVYLRAQVFVQYGMAMLTVSGERTRISSSVSNQVTAILAQGGVKVSLMGPGVGTGVAYVVAAKDSARALQLLNQTLFRKIGRHGARPSGPR